VTHLGEDGGFMAAEHVDPGRGSGNQSLGPSGLAHSRDCEARGVFAQYGSALSAGARQNRYVPDIGKAERDLGLKCRYGLEEAIRHAAEVLADNEV